KTVKMVKDSGAKLVLDVATGTGDMAIKLVESGIEKVNGVDISEGMLNVGKEKVAKLGLQERITLQVGDGENLPFPDNTFDAITISFGIRNFENVPKGLSDLIRVLKPGGKLFILEFSKPRVFPVKQGY